MYTWHGPWSFVYDIQCVVAIRFNHLDLILLSCKCKALWNYFEMAAGCNHSSSNIPTNDTHNTKSIIFLNRCIHIHFLANQVEADTISLLLSVAQVTMLAHKQSTLSDTSSHNLKNSNWNSHSGPPQSEMCKTHLKDTNCETTFEGVRLNHRIKGL